jgi:hypothetical protein
MLLSSIFASAQSSDWNFLVPPKGDVDLFSMRSMDLNSSGIIIAGTFKTVVEFNGKTLYNSDGDGIYAAHYLAGGIPISISKLGRSLGLPSNHTINAVLDNHSGYYLGIQFKDSLWLDTIKLIRHGDYDFVIAKYNMDDSLIWFKHFGSNDLDGTSISSRTMIVDESGSLIFTGLLKGTQFIDTFNFISTSEDAFVMKLDSSGEVKYLKGFGSATGWDLGNAIEKDIEENIFCLANFQRINSIYIDNIQILASNEYSSPTIDAISKWDSNGNIKWVRHFGGATYNGRINAGIVKTDSKGNVYVSGSFRCQGSFDQVKVQGGGLYNGFGNDVFVLKYDKDGNFKWFKHTTITDEEEWRGFDISDQDELYLTYAFNTMSKFETDSVQSFGGRDIAIVKLDTLGNVVWMNSIGGLGGEEVVSLLCSDTTVYLLGQSLSAPCHFNQTDHTTQSLGNLFLARLNKYEVWPLGVSEHKIPSFILYPNPSVGNTTMLFSNPMQGYYSLHDLAGRELLHQNLNPSQTHYTISTSSLSNGMYVLKLHTPQGQRSEKLVVE